MHSHNPEQAPEPVLHAYSSISTERIMQAVERQRRITDQLVSLESRQQARLARVRRAYLKISAAIFLLMGIVILVLAALYMFQPDTFLAVVAFSGGIIDFVMQAGRYLMTGLAFITGQSWLLALIGLAVVVIAGLWLRLMRTPREA
jgi:hypothetical protein